MRWSILLGAAAIGAVGAFERRTEPARDESMADLLQQMGGGLDPTKLEAAMKGMGLSGGIGDMAKMMEEMGGSDMMRQMQQAMSDPETQAQMLKFAEQMQQAVLHNPQLQQLSKSIEGLGLGDGLSAALHKLQDDPELRDVAQQMQAGDAGPETMARAMELGQKAFAQVLSDPEHAAKFQQAMAQMMNPETMAAMAEQFGAMLGGEQGGDMADLFAQLGQGARGAGAKDDDGLGGIAWDKDEM